MDKNQDLPIETVEQQLSELREGSLMEANAFTSMTDLAQQLIKSNSDKDKKEIQITRFPILIPVRPIKKDENVVDYVEPLVETSVLESMSRKWTKEKEMALASGQSEAAKVFSKCSKDLCKLIQETRQASGQIGLSKQPTRRGSNAQKQHEEKCSRQENRSQGNQASRKARKKGHQGSSEAIQGV